MLLGGDAMLESIRAMLGGIAAKHVGSRSQLVRYVGMLAGSRDMHAGGHRMLAGSCCMLVRAIEIPPSCPRMFRRYPRMLL
jgi:hypothetical protein